MLAYVKNEVVKCFNVAIATLLVLVPNKTRGIAIIMTNKITGVFYFKIEVFIRYRRKIDLNSTDRASRSV